MHFVRRESHFPKTKYNGVEGTSRTVTGIENRFVPRLRKESIQFSGGESQSEY